jgi:hypothetical protein
MFSCVENVFEYPIGKARYISGGKQSPTEAKTQLNLVADQSV